MKETLKLVDGYQSKIVASSLGYVINLSTGRCLFARTATNQFALTRLEGGQVYQQMRQFIAEQFGVPTGSHNNVWHLDNNPYNNAAENLWAIEKKSHLDKGYRTMLRLLEAGKPIDEIHEATKLGESFISKCIASGQDGRPKPFLYKPGTMWTMERIHVCTQHFIQGDSTILSLELTPDYIQRNQLEQPTILNLVELA